jgi:pimeloyl-ACP methyl ester carboxylesterase
MNFDAPTANDGSGAQFTNLGYLLNTRDNNREAVMDLLNLNASLKGLDADFVQAQGAKLNLGNVNVVGHSLGGILGSVFVTVNQVAIANDAKIGLPSNLNPIRSLVASVAGTQVAQVLVNSATFSPVINAGLSKAGVNVGTSNYEKFMYAAQSAVDSGDPVNFAQLLSTLKIPVLLQQVKDDLVIPNSADSAPLTGTVAFARLLGTKQLGLGETQLGADAGYTGYVKLNAGEHASLLRPSTAAPQVTAEMQTQVVSFLLGAGKVAVGVAAPQNIDAPN